MYIYIYIYIYIIKLALPSGTDSLTASMPQTMSLRCDFRYHFLTSSCCSRSMLLNDAMLYPMYPMLWLGSRITWKVGSRSRRRLLSTIDCRTFGGCEGGVIHIYIYIYYVVCMCVLGKDGVTFTRDMQSTAHMGNQARNNNIDIEGKELTTPDRCEQTPQISKARHGRQRQDKA